MVTTLDHELIVRTNAPETRRIRAVADLLESTVRSPQLVMASGETVEIPASLYAAWRHVAALMAQGATISLAPLTEDVTTQQAADLLNVSRPTVVKLLEDGRMPYYTTEGGHRRLLLDDVLAYKRQRRACSSLRDDGCLWPSSRSL